MRAKPTALALAILLALAATGCHGTAPPSAARPPSPTPASPVGRLILPPARGSSSLPSEDPNDPLLMGYCSAQDRVVTLEGKLLSRNLPLDASLEKMREAQHAARTAEVMFRHAGEDRLAHLASLWARSFEQVRARLTRGERPFDSLRPAIMALGSIERIFTCELDG